MEPSNMRFVGPLLLIVILGLTSASASSIKDFEILQADILKQNNKLPFINIDSNTATINQQVDKFLGWMNHLLKTYKKNPSMVKQIKDIINKVHETMGKNEMDRSDEYVDGSDHPCYRTCVEGENMVCHYKFELEPYHSMSKACFQCPFNATDCAGKDCIPADGFSRSLTVINRKFPGPKIEVCLGDTIVVDLINNLLDEETTVHWHGPQQRNTPYMDGVPLLTQCPISVASTFRYKFYAEQFGTQFWHSHIGMQRADGHVGSLIVREPKSVHQDLYDFDLSEHVMLVIDYMHERGTAIFTTSFHAGGRMSPDSILVNGKGRSKRFGDENGLYIPVEKLNVQKGNRYRFRLINAGFHVCPFEMSIVGHNITVISSDGFDFEPVEAVSLVSYAGERFDFILNADQDVDNYWIMFRGLLNCDPRFKGVKQVALLHYEGASDVEPEDAPSWEESHREGLQVNSLNQGTGVPGSVAIPELTATSSDDISLSEKPDHQFFIAYDFNTKDNTSFNKPPYGINQVPSNFRTSIPQFNHITMKMQNFALLPGRDQIIPEKHLCNESTVENCDKEFCACTHVISVPLNSVVELVLVDEGKIADSNHPMHLHGYSFRVVAMERLGRSTTVEEVKKLDAEGKIPRKLSKAPIKDTVTVPDGGYTIVRFLADNPGLWIFHCHIELHADVGMALAFKVGEFEDFPPVPKNFPTCGDFIPEEEF